MQLLIIGSLTCNSMLGINDHIELKPFLNSVAWVTLYMTTYYPESNIC